MRILTDYCVSFDVLALRPLTVVLRSKLFFPCLQIVSQCIAAYLELGDAHGGICGACMSGEGTVGERVSTRDVHATRAGY